MTIREKINLLVRQIGSIRDSAKLDNRTETMAELEEMDGKLDEISGLEEILKRQKPNSPLTVPIGGDFDNPIYRNITNNQIRGETNIMKNSKGEYKNFGNFLTDVMAAASPGGQVNSRLFKAGETRAAQGLSESVGSDGGFLVQQDFADALLDRAFETGLLAKRCRQMPITVGTSLKVPGIDETSRATGSRWGGVQAYWIDEATEKTKSKPKFRQIELNLHKLIGLCYATDELLQDASALSAYITTAFSEEFGFVLDDSIINGLGAGQPLGILNAGCMVSVSKETGQAADTLDYSNVLKMWSRLIANAREDAIWLINQDCEPQLHSMSLAVGTGGAPVYLPAGGASNKPHGTLFGRPVIPCEQCQTVGTTGDINPAIKYTTMMHKQSLDV